MKLSLTITLITMILSPVASLLRGGRQLAVVTEEEPLQALLEVALEKEDQSGTKSATDHHDYAAFEMAALDDVDEEEITKIEISSPTDVEERTLTTSYSFYGYDGYACRTDHGGKGYEGYDYHRYYNVYSKHWCEAKCSNQSSCKGYEYSDYDNHCEIWYNFYHQYESNPGFSCYYKGN